MLKPKTRWVVQQADKEKSEMLSSRLNITPLVAELLVNRGLDTYENAKDFLFGNDEAFHDPFLLPEMDRAIGRIKEGIRKQEPILIFGDYDADGVTSTSVMMLALKDLGANVQFYIPNRFTEGYGPNEQAFRMAAQRGIRLIITVDTGISAVHEAAIAKELGIDLIITDHHEIGSELPDSYAIIHPRRPGSTYPFQDLAGVGVAFKLAHALYGKAPAHLIELAAIGTIADLVPLTGENRLIVKKGLNKLRMTERVGLKALFESGCVDQSAVDEDTIGFVIAPRINAVGRLSQADPAVHLLLTEDVQEAKSIARMIEQTNRDRQELVNSITLEAVKEVEENYSLDENKVLVLGKEGWNEGVIGIVASKLVEKYYRPVIVLNLDKTKGIAKGSARSIEGFDLYQNLSCCKDLLLHFGGHKGAAGMSLRISDIDRLRTQLNELAESILTDDDFIPVTKLDGEIELKDIQIETIEEIQLLAPFGMNNPKPKFLLKGNNISQLRKIGVNQDHLKLILENGGVSLEGVGFGLGHLFEDISLNSKLSVIGELAINEWNNIRKPQIFLEDVKIDTWQLFDYRGYKQIKHLQEVVPDGIWVIFNKAYYNKFKEMFYHQIVLIDTDEKARELDMDHKNVFLFDLPPRKERLETLLLGKNPERVYIYFYHETSDYFSTMPTREHFKWYYRFLAKRSPFDLKKYGDELAKYRGWTKETVWFMSKVFLELGFIYLNDGFVILNKEPLKRDLSDSITYQQKQAHYILEKELLYSSTRELKVWFNKLIQGSTKYEEAVK